MEVFCECLNLLEEKLMKIVYKYGNILFFLIVFVFVDVVEEGCIKDNDNVLFVGFGGGLIWGVLIICWGK